MTERELNGCGPAPKVIWPVPPKTTVLLEKAGPPKATVAAEAGAKTRVPELVTVPRLLKLPSKT